MKRKTGLRLLSIMLPSMLLLTACGSSETAPVVSLSQPSGQSANSITVNSSEKVTVVPDIAEIVYSVQTQETDASKCQQKNAEDVTQVLELLKSLGVPDSSVQTSGYYMNPVYDYSSNTERIKGYSAVTTLTASGVSIDGLGDFLTKSVSTGINSVESITYEASKYDEAYQEALKLAVAGAGDKAAVLAEAGSCTVGSILSIEENSSYSEARYTDNALKSTTAVTQELSDQSSMDIMPGEVEVEADITVQYQIQ